ncbi:MAG: T9SS type A sorting domain-containing protein [Chitinophagales bacterium]|nr:T9SS type A sorting domain-containing protein [Bacteroidota bacterium]MCB9042607.1 T9SS type A sorting domain-containing protein [Chitinophagales bacterium]
MRRILLLILFALLSNVVFAQLPIDNFPDFDHNDLNGQRHHFYQYLDEGNVVVVYFFDMWDATCQERASAFNEVYEAHGPDGDNTAVIIGIQSQTGTSDEAAKSWPANYPVINVPKSCSDKPNCGLPHYYVVCPDGYWTKVDGNPANLANNFSQAIQSCPTFPLDASILSINKNQVSCESEYAPEAYLYNRGTETLNNATLVVRLNDEIATFYTWNGTLNQYANTKVKLDPIPMPTETGVHDLSIEVTNPNDGTDQQVANNIKSEKIYVINPAEAENLVLEIQPDDFPEEVVWQIKTMDEEVVLAEGRDYAGYFTQALCAVKGECYKLMLWDEGNDGFAFGGGSVYQNGYKLMSFTSDDHNIGYTTFTFCLETEDVSGNGPTETGGSSPNTGILDNNNIAMQLYPNPINDVLYINTPENITQVSLYNLQGKEILSTQTKNNQLDVSAMPNGLYLIQIQTRSGLFTQKVSIAH